MWKIVSPQSFEAISLLLSLAYIVPDATLLFLWTLQASLDPQWPEITLQMSSVVLGTCPLEGQVFCSRRFSCIISLVTFFSSIFFVFSF